MTRLVLIYAALPIALGSTFAVGPLDAYWLRQQAHDWKPTQVEVTGSDFSCFVGRRGSTVFSVHASYRYETGGKLYFGDSVVFGGNTFATCGEAERVAKAFPLGSKPVGFVDPNDPHRSVLYRDQVAYQTEGYLAGASMVGIAAILLGFAGWREDRHNGGPLRTFGSLEDVTPPR